MNIQVNYLALLIAAVASMIAGFLWYSQALFGKKWMKLMGYSSESLKKAQKEMGKLYFLSFVVSIVSAYVLSHVMVLTKNFFGYPSLQTGITSAFWMWLGFVMPVQVTNTIFSDKNWELFGINTGYQLTSLILMGLAIGIMT